MKQRDPLDYAWLHSFTTQMNNSSPESKETHCFKEFSGINLTSIGRIEFCN